MRKVILYLLLTLLCMPCSVFKRMSVKDRDDSNKHIALTSGEQVAVHLPEIRKDLIGTIFLATGWSVADRLREHVLNELSRRGINARADSTLNGNYLKINLNEFKGPSGSHGSEGIELGGGWAICGRRRDYDPGDFEGTVTLRTTKGKRELEFIRRIKMSTSGKSEIAETIHALAGELVKKITIDAPGVTDKSVRE